MNIILLSGGSGKRLWPLSNDVRSKQFIKLFKDGDKYESMVQRVYRQITTVDADAKITIATSKSQASAIKNQLGEKASICVEPCRRDTFPAIALAAAYLHDELGVGTDEAVVVCPVDPYVDNTYYEAVKTLQELVEQGNANLTLMGIEPTYPSEKYGYIIPESGENVSKVKEFKEKPDVETAKKYLAQSALWNAGIFAFKLGYLLDKAHSMIDFEDYRDLFNKYDTLTKISFDYAVVEKENSIQVLRYSGDWKDVGTWNMMAEVMADKTKGKAILDETCENTNVVNELNIPILCMGCKDMIIAASGDGILISDKERSGYMKPYVEKIETEAMYAEKSWTKWYRMWRAEHPEFEKIVFHGLRHSSATYQLLQSGGDFKSVQGNTGHATATVLMDTYAHTQDKPRLELTEKIEADFYTQDVAGAKPQEPPENKTPVATKITGKMILEAIRQMDAEERRELTRVLFA